ncbi:MAG: B12-binding domain-containing radical SAM protein [Candidatus Helarchaeota archaeon]
MEYDCVLSLIPPYTINTPSSGLALLHTYLKEKGINIQTIDFSPGFYYKYLKDFDINHSFKFKINLFPLIGYTLLLFDSKNFFSIKNVGKHFLESLSPIHLDLFNEIFQNLRDKTAKFYNILDKYVQNLISFDTNIYAFSVNITNVIATLKVIQNIKRLKPNSIIILGGPETFPTYRRDLYVNLDIIDYVIYHNDGTYPLFKLIDSLKQKSNLSIVPGLALKKNNHIYITELPPKINLNDLPFPIYDELTYFDYKFKNFQKLELLATKGCDGRCSFCNEPSIWNPIISKSPNNILKEIKYYLKNYGIDKFEISDNAFNITTNFTNALKLLDQENLHISFGGNCKLNNLNQNRIKIFKKYGLTHCFYGLESGSQKVLNLMKKDLNIRSATKLIRLTSELDIDVVLYLIIGFPGELDIDFESTINFLDDNRNYIDDIIISVFTLMNNSPIFNSKSVIPIRLGPKILNCFTYKTQDGITHKKRAERYLKIKEFWEPIHNVN